MQRMKKERERERERERSWGKNSTAGSCSARRQA